MKFKNMNITIDITTKCNLHCKHCRTNEIDHELTIDELKRIVNKCKKFKPMGVFISGGEPLTRKDIVDVVKLTKELAPVTILNTNSLLLTEDLLKQLIEVGLNYIQVSLDGTEKSHDEIRGKGTYRKAIEKMHLINKYNDKIKLHISSLVTKFNVDYMEDFVHQILDVEGIDVDILGFKRFIPNNELAGKGNLGKDGLEKMYNNLSLLQKKYNDKSKIVADFPIKNIYQREKSFEIMKKFNLNCVGCSAGVNGICIRNDGTVSPCSLLYINCGNILQNNLDNILNSDPMVKIMNRDVKGKCGTCKNKLICGGCRAAAYQLTGDFLNEDTECYL